MDLLDRYASPEMAHIWSLRAQLDAWLFVATEQVAVRYGDMPDLRDLLREHKVGVAEFLAEEKLTRHDVVAFLNVWTKDMPHLLRRLVHRGLTSSDLVDTALAYRISRSIDMIQIRFATLINVLSGLALKYKDVARVGRTHGQVAELTTLGYQLLKHTLDLAQSYSKLDDCQKNDLLVKMSGAVGGYRWSTVDHETALAASMGPEFSPAGYAGQCVSRHHLARVMGEIAILAGNLENLAMFVRLGQTLGELAEGFSPAQIGSSSMPHKRNPIACEGVAGLARLVRAQVPPVLESISMWGEHDIAHSSVERVAIPTAFALAERMIITLTRVFDPLHIDLDEINNNVDSTTPEHTSSAKLVNMVDKGAQPAAARRYIAEGGIAWEGLQGTKLPPMRVDHAYEFLRETLEAGGLA